MGFIKNIRGLEGNQGLFKQVQSIAEEIDSSLPISPKRYQDLSRRLGKTFGDLGRFEEDEKATHVFAQAQAEALKERCNELSLKLAESLFKREIELIHQESEALKHAPITAKAVKALEKHINSLLEHYAPSQEQNRVLFDAKKTLHDAKAKLEGREVVSHFEWLATQYTSATYENLELIPGEIEDLFDIAKALWDGSLKKAQMHFFMLPESHKRQFEAHMHFLGGVPFVNIPDTMRALIATAHQVANNPELYLTDKQMDQLFTDLNQIAAEEIPQRKIFSLKQS